jgi:hypothetical protein
LKSNARDLGVELAQRVAKGRPLGDAQNRFAAQAPTVRLCIHGTGDEHGAIRWPATRLNIGVGCRLCGRGAFFRARQFFGRVLAAPVIVN